MKRLKEIKINKFKINKLFYIPLQTHLSYFYSLIQSNIIQQYVKLVTNFNYI